MEWVVYDEYPNYEINKWGEVKYVNRDKYVVPEKNRNGEISVNVKNKYGRYRRMKLKHLVYEAFNGKLPKYTKVYCVDGDEENLYISNLNIKKSIPHDDLLREFKVRDNNTGTIYYNVWACSDELDIPTRYIVKDLTSTNRYHGSRFELLFDQED